MDIDQLILDEENLVRTVASEGPKCVSCIHWNPYGGVLMKMIEEAPRGGFTIGGQGIGECRRYPPQMPSEGSSFSQFPKTGGAHSCGEWQIREWQGQRTKLV